LRGGNFPAAFEFFSQQYAMGNLDAGFRLADMHLKGQGTPRDPARAFALFQELAHEGEVVAEYELGVAYEYGNGVPIDDDQAATWYRLAARHGSLAALFSLGGLHAHDRIVPRDDVEGLALLLEASARATGEDPASRFVLQHQPAQAKLLTERMTPADIARAHAKAAELEKTVVPLGEPDRD